MKLVKNLLAGSRNARSLPPQDAALSPATSDFALAAGLNSLHKQSVSTSIGESGIQLSALLRLAKALSKGHASSFDTYSLVNKHIKPLLHNTSKNRLFNLIDPSCTGKPHYCISYPWSMPFVDMVDQVVHELTKKGSSTPDVPKSLDRIYVWLDVIALNQQIPFKAQADLSIIKSLVKSCTLGLAFVVDSSLSALSRSWCLFEAWSFVYHSGGGISKLRACLPLDLTLDLIVSYEDLVDNMDVNKSESSKPDDKIKIISEIKGSSGLKIMQKSIQEALVVSLRSGLRWGSDEEEDLRSLGLYAGLLLKGAEYHRLQRLLHEIPSIQNDEDMLREVEQVFNLYIDGPDEELDEDQFCQVLMKAGFTSDEVHPIYHEVNTDGGPGVGPDEFKRWWLLDATRRHASDRKRRPPISLTPESLVDNLWRMRAALEREDHIDLVSKIKAFMSSDKFRSEVREGRDLPPSSRLKGDIRDAAERVSWLLHQREYKDALLVLIEIILWNLDSVDIPPASLPRPDRDDLLGEAFFLALATYLEQFALLLKYEGHKNQEQHSAYFLKFASEVRHPPTLRLLVEAYEVQGRISKTQDTSAKLQSGKFDIVRDMISLKYGQDQPVNHSLIVEAEKSLSTWMAGNRRNVQQTTTTVGELASDYFTSQLPSTTSRASEINVVSVPIKNDIKGLVEAQRRLAPDGHEPSVLSKLGPEAAAFAESLRALDAANKDREREKNEDGEKELVRGTPGTESELNGAAPGLLKKVQSRRRSSITELDDEVASLMQLAGGSGAFESSFGAMQSKLQLNRGATCSPTPSPSACPLRQYVQQQSTRKDASYSLEASAQSPSPGRGASVQSPSSNHSSGLPPRSPSVSNNNYIRERSASSLSFTAGSPPLLHPLPSLSRSPLGGTGGGPLGALPPSNLGARAYNRSSSSLGLGLVSGSPNSFTSKMARRATLDSLGPGLAEGKSGGISSVPGLAASLLASAGIGSSGSGGGESTRVDPCSPPDASHPSKSLMSSRLLSIDRSGHSESTIYPTPGSPSSQSVAGNPSFSKRSMGVSPSPPTYLPTLPNIHAYK